MLSSAYGGGWGGTFGACLLCACLCSPDSLRCISRRAIFYFESVCFLSSPSFLALSRHQHYANNGDDCVTTAGNINENDEYKGGPTIKCYGVSR